MATIHMVHYWTDLINKYHINTFFEMLNCITDLEFDSGPA